MYNALDGHDSPAPDGKDGEVILAWTRDGQVLRLFWWTTNSATSNRDLAPGWWDESDRQPPRDGYSWAWVRRGDAVPTPDESWKAVLASATAEIDGLRAGQQSADREVERLTALVASLCRSLVDARHNYECEHGVVEEIERMEWAGVNELLHEWPRDDRPFGAWLVVQANERREGDNPGRASILVEVDGWLTEAGGVGGTISEKALSLVTLGQRVTAPLREARATIAEHEASIAAQSRALDGYAARINDVRIDLDAARADRATLAANMNRIRAAVGATADGDVVALVERLREQAVRTPDTERTLAAESSALRIFEMAQALKMARAMERRDYPTEILAAAMRSEVAEFFGVRGGA